MRIIIDITDTVAGSTPVEIHVPERATSQTITGEVASGAVPGELQQYDGGADMGTPLPAEPSSETETAAPTALAPGTAIDGGAAPSPAETESAQRIPTQIEGRLS
jgi:hypothetical protein